MKTADEMFHYSERMKENPEAEKELAELKSTVEESQKKYDAKKAEFYQKRKEDEK